MQERLQKFLANAGVASRRHAEEIILAGKVSVNGRTITKLGTKIDPERDEVKVQGKKIKPRAEFVYLALNKPKRYMTTRSDPQKRRTVYDLLPADLRNKVWPVGRLDFNTEGLLLFTNDGELTQKLSHPSAEHEKEYEVALDRELSEGKMDKIRKGIILDGKKTSPSLIRAAPRLDGPLRSLASSPTSRSGRDSEASESRRANGPIVYLTIHEGAKRQIRRMFSALGYTVRNLKRIRIARLKLGDLKPGRYRVIKKQDIA